MRMRSLQLLAPRVATRDRLAVVAVIAAFLVLWAALFFFEAVVLGDGLGGAIGLLVMSVVFVVVGRLVAYVRGRRRQGAGRA